MIRGWQLEQNLTRERTMSSSGPPLVEARRLEEDAARKQNWTRWGPYLSERQWATVREDYSADGRLWDFLTHDQSRSRAYRWGEDGLLGICDRECRLCFALALWNEKDPILKERLFGLTSPEGNHSEDVKECYFYLDSTPAHSYLKALYKYPQAEFPYGQLLEENRRRGRTQPEFELVDTGVFDEDRYFDVLAEYAKATPDDILIRITVSNRGPDAARLHLLPTLWFRNTWSWGSAYEEGEWPKPVLRQSGPDSIDAEHVTLGHVRLIAAPGPNGEAPAVLFTENESGGGKDAFHRYVIGKDSGAIRSERNGTKAAAHYIIELPPRSEATIRLRLFTPSDAAAPTFGAEFDQIFAERIAEADAFYSARIPQELSDDERRIARQAYAGLLWSKQFYHYIVAEWLRGDRGHPNPPESRWRHPNADWMHLHCRDVLSVPDKWEYPAFFAWDLAWHTLPLARIDPDFAKHQLLLFMREWYMRPNGQLPAFEYDLSNVNPPVHAYACWRVYKISGERGDRDIPFLERAFHKLLLNFTWWVNREDQAGRNVFSGGFLGLDNIGVFDRSLLPTGYALEQADGTAWMGLYCTTMLAIAMELARHDHTYEDIASKFFEHFVQIADALNTLGGTGLWDEEDGFYYDHLKSGDRSVPLKVRSLVGWIPLLAVEVLDEDHLLPEFVRRTEWFLTYRKELSKQIAYLQPKGEAPDRKLLLALPSRQRLERALRHLLDEEEFLSPYGVRSLSKVHLKEPYVFRDEGREYRVGYVPGDMDTQEFGGNSNWRGPVWFPINFLLVEALERYHHFYGDDLRVECPTGSGRLMNLAEVAGEISERLRRLFRADARGERPGQGAERRFASDQHWKDLILFYEYFHGDNGSGLGASHQTGWTSLIVRLLEDAARTRNGA
jgi:Glycosyl hydrolase family 63 C-terminal domain